MMWSVHRVFYVWTLVACLARAWAPNPGDPALAFPLQFSATLQITSGLIEEESEYPPKRRHMTIYYDYINKKARADIEAGYEAAKIYIRRYDQKKEYMVRLPPIDDCKRSYLGEVMPFPDISHAEFVRVEEVEGSLCNYFIHEDYDTRIHVYMDQHSGAPVRLVQEGVDMQNEESTIQLTYDYTDVELGAPDDSWFDIPSPYEHASCARHVGGFPYLHVFHYFVKF
mmetsp:Transcript_14529/g.32033  ORF Transcript_14529/g.32033 Transcript_14529/m.32033 type:complete len:226 (-) Transcript_14529:1348-2025(-)